VTLTVAPVLSSQRVAVWGLGPHARSRILPAIAASKSTLLAGVCTRDAQVGARAAKDFETRYFANPEEMLRGPDVDVVYLATPTGLHAEQGNAVLASGKHLWCEKSLAESATAVRALVAQSQRAKLGVCEAFMYLHHPQWAQIRSLVSEELGLLRSISSRFTMPSLDNPGFRHSAQLGGGALLDVGCYPLSLALALCEGEPNVAASSVRSSRDLPVDTEGYATLEFPNGCLVQLEWGYGRAYLNDLAISAENGSLVADRVFSKSASNAPTIEVRDLRGNKRAVEVPDADAFVAMLDFFAKSVGDAAEMERLRGEALRQALNLERIAVRR